MLSLAICVYWCLCEIVDSIQCNVHMHMHFITITQSPHDCLSSPAELPLATPTAPKQLRLHDPLFTTAHCTHNRQLQPRLSPISLHQHCVYIGQGAGQQGLFSNWLDGLESIPTSHAGHGLEDDSLNCCKSVLDTTGSVEVIYVLSKLLACDPKTEHDLTIRACLS